MLRTCEGDRVPSGEFITERLVAMPEKKEEEIELDTRQRELICVQHVSE